jgi:acyl-CoA thioesterase-1
MGNGFVGWFARSYKGIILALVAIMAVMLIILAMQHVNASRPAVGAEAAPAPTFTSEAHTRPLAAFLGDSYTAGAGASSPAKAFPALVAGKEEWRSIVVGCGGSGYVNNGTCHQNYTVRVADVVKRDPSIVVVSGGRNDVDFPTDQISANAVAVFGELKSKLPDAKIYVTSPVWDDDAAPAKLAEVQAAIRASAEKAGATYVDIGQPLTGKAADMIADGVHPNDTGHGALADAIASALPER